MALDSVSSFGNTRDNTQNVYRGRVRVESEATHVISTLPVHGQGDSTTPPPPSRHNHPHFHFRRRRQQSDTFTFSQAS